MLELACRSRVLLNKLDVRCLILSNWLGFISAYVAQLDTYIRPPFKSTVLQSCTPLSRPPFGGSRSTPFFPPPLLWHQTRGMRSEVATGLGRLLVDLVKVHGCAAIATVVCRWCMV